MLFVGEVLEGFLEDFWKVFLEDFILGDEMERWDTDGGIGWDGGIS